MVRGLQQETITLHEYTLKKAEEGVNVQVHKSGLAISTSHKFLGGSPDGYVNEIGGESGLVEVKNLLHAKNINLTQAATEVKNFCLCMKNGVLLLKRTHDYYHQCQGFLAVTNLPWIDFVVRTVNPYQMHIERIRQDIDIWETKTLPKLSQFYHKAILPELCSPRQGKSPGIREPGVWFQDTSGERKGTCKLSSAHIRVRYPRSTVPGQVIPPSSHDVTPHPSTSSNLAGSANRTRHPRLTVPDQVIPPSSRDATPHPSTSDLAGSATLTRRSARSRVKFVVREISHQWTVDETTKHTAWYSGTVLGVISGTDGVDNAVYEIQYEGDNSIYEVDHLQEDYKWSLVRFIDL